MQTKETAVAKEIQFSDDVVVNPQDFIPAEFPNIQEIKPWLLHDHGFPVAIVFASNLDDALDIAADEGKLARFALTEEDIKRDYIVQERGHDPEEVGIARLGNHNEPFDIQNLDIVEMAAPPFSFVALWNAANG